MLTILDEVRNLFSEESLNEIMGMPAGRAQEIARVALTKVGHRWRPLLFVGVWREFHELCDIPRNVKEIAVAIECIHKASMIHDDIEDDDKSGALHRTVGIAQALNAGDLLIHESYRLLIASGLEREGIAISNECQRTLCFGQGQELAIGGDFSFQKTSPGFEVAFRLAMVGNLSEPKEKVLAFCLSLGIAYQAKDDYEDGASSGIGRILKQREAFIASQQFDNPELVKFLDGYLSLVFSETRYPLLPTSQGRSSVPAP